jgi:polysaccharide biosynthesis/export protein
MRGIILPTAQAAPVGRSERQGVRLTATQYPEDSEGGRVMQTIRKRRPRPVSALYATLVLLLLPAAVGAQASGGVAANAGTAPTALDTALAEEARPGDLVRIRIWQEDDLSGEFPVEETGHVVLPRLGPVDVRGLAPDALRTDLMERYEAFLPHSSISIVVLRRVQILGAVRNPGLYSVEPTMTVSDALALAGGITNRGKSRIDLVRGGQRISADLSSETPIAGSPLRSGDQLHVPERGWFSRNGAIVSAAIVSLTVALIRR